MWSLWGQCPAEGSRRSSYTVPDSGWPLAALNYNLTPRPAFDRPLLHLKIKVFTFQAGRNYKMARSYNIQVRKGS